MNKGKTLENTRTAKGIIIKIGIVWLCILVLAGFLIARGPAGNSTNLSIIPVVPQTGEPIVATINIPNPSNDTLTTDYELYVNGLFVQSGTTSTSPQSSTQIQYAYRHTLERGEQINFVLHTVSNSISLENQVSLPPYPPHIMSSLVSMAAFSTSVMSSLVSMQYFNDTFGTTSSINAGIIFSIVLIILLIFLELTQTVRASNKATVLSRYRFGFTNVSAILFIIFIGMVFTKIVMILAT
jgi:hypothetical protein